MARRSEDVGPGVKMEFMRSVTKAVAMVAGAVGCGGRVSRGRVLYLNVAVVREVCCNVVRLRGGCQYYLLCALHFDLRHAGIPYSALLSVSGTLLITGKRVSRVSKA